jgi:hypothetical protein
VNICAKSFAVDLAQAKSGLFLSAAAIDLIHAVQSIGLPW